MHSFPDLIKKIREEAGLTQAEFAKSLEVSGVLIAMIETGQKEVSKNFLLKLAEKMDVHPSSITPFLFIRKDEIKDLSSIEKSLMQWGEKMQEILIKNRSKKFKEYAK